MSFSGTPFNRADRIYACVWCHRRYLGKSKLVQHEPLCDARYVVRRTWATEIDRARKKEIKDG